MADLSELRNAAVAFLVLLAASASLGALTPLNWIAILSLAVVLASASVLIDILFFKHLMRCRSRTRHMVLVALFTSGISGILCLSLAILEEDSPPPDGYPYLVASSSDSATEVKAVPSPEAGVLNVVFSGEDVQVSCYVGESKHRWYRLHDRAGWLSETNLLAAPHTGLGLPPRCPD